MGFWGFITTAALVVSLATKIQDAKEMAGLAFSIVTGGGEDAACKLCDKMVNVIVKEVELDDAVSAPPSEPHRTSNSAVEESKKSTWLWPCCIRASSLAPSLATRGERKSTPRRWLAEELLLRAVADAGCTAPAAADAPPYAPCAYASSSS